jgi:hypothetical protein
MASEKTYRELNRELSVIYHEVLNLRLDQHIFWEVQDIIRANPSINVYNEFYSWMSLAYAASMSAAIRRQVDKRKDTISFVGFLRRLARQPGVVTRARYKSLSITAPKDHMDGDFDQLVGVGRDTMNPTEIQKDIDDLIAKANVVKRYTDSIIAHHGKIPPPVIPKFSDVDEAIELLEKLLKKYFLLFRAKRLRSALPEIVDDWKAIFRVAWIGTDKP